LVNQRVQATTTNLLPMNTAILLAALAAATSLPSALATVTWLTATLDGVQANDGWGTGSPGTGKALVSYDDATGVLTWEVSWKDLAGNPTLMNLRGPADRGASAGVQVDLGVADNPAGGAATITPAQAADLLEGLWYVNLQTSAFVDGEIRGQVERALMNYWPLVEGSDWLAANTVPGGYDGVLNGGVSWVDDPQQGTVLAFDGAALTYVDAGFIGPIAPEAEFTWSFWSHTDAAQPVNNDIILGNRQPDSGWCKFTPTQFEFRDLAPTFNTPMDYPNFLAGAWVHSAVVKRGALMTYYRNGIAQLNAVAGGTLPEWTPLYFGGDPAASGEGWQGMIDDVATWRAALPTVSVQGLADNTLRPDTAPLLWDAVPLIEVFADRFDGDLSAWTPTSRGLENNTPAGYDAPAIAGGGAVLGGATSSQYWYGSSLESARTFDSRLQTEVSVKRVSLAGSGTAYRASVWILGDDGHYLHFAQNIGENGWQYNARDDGGTGTLNEIGGGNNLALLDPLDADTGTHEIRLRLLPTSTEGKLNIEMRLDGLLVGVHGFDNFPNAFRVVLSGQARAANDSVSAVFDDVVVKRIDVPNLPPVFTADSFVLPSAQAGLPYRQSVAAKAGDPESGPLTFSKVDGAAWINVAPDGTLSGAPGTGDVGPATVALRVTDSGGKTADATVRLRVQGEAAAPLLYGWWPLNDGAGSVVRNVSGTAPDGSLVNESTGGLGAAGEAWVVDAEGGMVLSFNGEETGSYVSVGAIAATGLDGDFTLACRVKSDQAPNNDIVVGNRYSPTGAEYTPRQFVKLTTRAFEWHWNGAGENVDIEDMPRDVWVHHAVVKEGPALFYYRDGVLADMRTITGAPNVELPLFFGGQGVENWRGYLSDVRLFTTALSDSQALAVFEDKKLPGLDVAFTSVSVSPAKAVTLAWTPLPAHTYGVWVSKSFSGWVKVEDGLSTDTYTVMPGGTPDTATEPHLFFQVRATPSP